MFLTIFLQILVYGVGVYVLFDEKTRKFGVGILILVICTGIDSRLNLTISNILFVHFSSIIILWVLLEGTIRQKFWIVIKSVFIIACCEETIEAVIELILSQFLEMQLSSEEKFILANIILLVIWFILGEMKKRKIAMLRKHVSSLIMLTMWIMAVDLALVITCIHYADPYVNSKRYSMVSSLLTVISYFGIVLLGLYVIYVRKANVNYKYSLETESLLRNLQKNNYELMLAKEEETREFRHDISNHIMCLKEMIASGNLAEANQYADQMQTVISQIQKKNYSTGNEIMNTIFNHYLQLPEEEIEVSVTGLCNYDLAINNVELCSIISNLLQNTIEALNNQKQGKRYLKIRMNTTQQNFKMEIENSFGSDQIIMSGGLPRTIKKNKENHGIGLKNVKRLVEKNNGLLKVEIGQSEFRVTLILPVTK